MKRRSFLAATALAGAAGPLARAATDEAIIELTFYRLRNNKDNQVNRTRDFLTRSYVPALKRAGVAPVGMFTNLIGEQSPTILLVTSYPNLAGIDAVRGKLAADKRLGQRAKLFAGIAGLPYQRIEKTLLRGFDSFPTIQVPPGDKDRAPRVFEMRTYESDTFDTLRRKIGMFGNGEIDLFRKVGMAPVFFGETIVGQNMPNLTYMVGFDSLAHREQCWRKFGRSAEWRTMKKLPGLSDAEVVSNISNRIYRPLAGSDIR